VDFDAAVVVDEAQFSEFVHEETNARPRRSDHLRKRLLADFRDRRFGCSFLRFTVNGKEPATVMVVTVDQTFQHCPKALVRSNLWKAASGGRPQNVPTLGDFAAARYPETDSAAFDQAYSQRIPNELY
jgi:hypothetical protein